MKRLVLFNVACVCAMLCAPVSAEEASQERMVSPDWSWKLTAEGSIFFYRIEEERSSYNAFYVGLEYDEEEGEFFDSGVYYGYQGSVANAMRDLQSLGVDFIDTFLSDRSNLRSDEVLASLYFSEAPDAESAEWEEVGDHVISSHLRQQSQKQVRQANFIFNIWCWFTTPGTTYPGGTWPGVVNGTTTTTVSCGTCGKLCYGIRCCTNSYVWNAACQGGAGCWVYTGQVCGGCD